MLMQVSRGKLGEDKMIALKQLNTNDKDALLRCDRVFDNWAKIYL